SRGPTSTTLTRFGTRMSGLFRGLEIEQVGALFDLVADRVVHHCDCAIGRRRDGVLHFHGFYDEKSLAGDDRVALLGMDLDDLARHGRGQPAAGGIGADIRRAWIDEAQGPAPAAFEYDDLAVEPGD